MQGRRGLRGAEACRDAEGTGVQRLPGCKGMEGARVDRVSQQEVNPGGTSEQTETKDRRVKKDFFFLLLI